MTYNIAVLKGDGIGPEIINEAIKVLEAAGERRGFRFLFKEYLIGGAAYDETGSPLPPETVEGCGAADAVLLGAVGGPRWDGLPPGKRPEAGLLGIRKALGLYANLRPVKTFESLIDASPLRPEIIGGGLDLMIVRELTGGIYFGKKGREGPDAAYDTEYYRRHEVERIARAAFELAQKRSGRLCSVDKANVMESSRFWREIVGGMASDYPGVELSHMYVDNCAMQLIRNPSQFDVIVTSNMFGDILSDEASMLGGSIGMLASASLRRGQGLGIGGRGLYEPAHGSAPDIAGKNIANPLAAILSAAMLLRYSLNEEKAARMIEKAAETALGQARTADIYEEGYKKVSCSGMGDIVRQILT